MTASDGTTNARLATSIPFFAMLVAPLGVAGQNIGLGIALLMFILLVADSGIEGLTATLKSSAARQYMILWALMILPITSATVARGDIKEASRFFWGYLLSCFMVVASLTLRSYPLNRRFLAGVCQVLVCILGLVALSQFVIGWKLEHGEFTSQIKRAQGFYSHPLTLAYAALPTMPWITARFMHKPFEWKNAATWLALMVIILASQSVTGIVLTGFVVAFLAVKIMTRKAIISTFIAALLASAALVTIPNPIQAKFKAVLSGQRGDHETSYPDDRMAFWHANWEMFLDAPLTGHGTGLEQDDRRPFYEKIGLGHIKRMYESHNMYLQYAVEGGVIASLALLGFFIWWTLILAGGLTTDRWHRLAMVITPGIFALGGLTQNAIQDSEVRYLMLLVCSASLWFTRQQDQAISREPHS
jgi:O-antigen ligase